MMLASAGKEQDLKKKDTIFEPKLDGIRVLCSIKKDIQFFTRNGNNVTTQFPELVLHEAIDAKNCVLDGEIVVRDEQGNPDFSLIESRDQLASSLAIRMRAQQHPATFVVFDILEKDGKSLVKKPLSERKKILEETVQNTDRIQVIPYTTDGKALWKEIQERDIEAVIAKNIHGTYVSGTEGSDWLSIKRFNTLNCVIIGYIQKQRTITALALGIYDKKKLIYVGTVDTGFDEKILKNLHVTLKKITTTKSSIKQLDKNIIPVKPNIVCEVKYLEIAKDKKLKDPSFLKIRTDKTTEECVLST